MRLQLIIIADDLTGALDAAGPFAERGLATTVVADAADLEPALIEAPAILSINTHSREIAPDEAARKVAAVVRALPAGIRLFKKIDSRLKGNIEAELSAIPFERLAMLPAIPEFGRIVRNGQLAGFGVDVPICVVATLGKHAQSAVIPDTESREDMASALSAADGRLLVGARGLAEALARTLPNGPARGGIPPERRVTMVVGSRDPITLSQVQTLREAYPDLLFVAAPNGVAAAEDASSRAPRITVLQAVPGERPATGEAVAAALAKSLRDTCLEGRNMLLLTGGATAAGVLARLGIGRMQLSGELLPGLPIAHTGELTLITKSGGFGAVGALKDVADAVSESWETGR